MIEIEEFKVVKRYPDQKVQYGFVEVEVTGVIDNTEDLSKLQYMLDGGKVTAPIAEEEPEEVAKTVTKKRAPAKKKEPASPKISKNLLYDRDKAAHKKEYVDMLTLWNADWSNDKVVISRAKVVSELMEGKQLFDKDGEVLPEFIEVVVKEMEK